MQPQIPPSVERIVAEVGIPPCPEILTRVVREARSEEPDLEKISSLVASDAGLAASMLKTANSSLYAGTSPVTSVRQANMRIGLRNVVQLITGLMLKQAFTVSQNPGMQRFWELSSRVAALSACIAKRVGACDSETAFTFGLFRDCGTALMLSRFPDYLRLLAAAAKLGRRITDLEVARYGATHAQIGCALARSWLLSDSLCNAVLHHHSPDAQRGRRTDLQAESMRLIGVGAIAEHVHTLEEEREPGAEMAAASGFALLRFGLADSALDEILQEARATA